MRDVGQSDDNKPEDRARHFLDFWFLWFSDFLDFGFSDAEDKPEERARPGRATDNCICATGVVRALCCSEEEPGYCQLNVLQQVSCKLLLRRGA